LMTTNTNDAVMAPENQLERAFTIFCVLCSIGVIGSGASKMTSTIDALNRMNAQAESTKNQLQRYLSSSGVSVDLSSRIIHFALYSLERRAAMVLDPEVHGLLSNTLAAELTVSQRSPHLIIHPLFKLIYEWHREARLDVCDAFQAQLYSVGEGIFRPRTRAEFFCITSKGKYLLAPEDGDVSQRISASTNFAARASATAQVFDQPHWFSEIGLFARVMHCATLSAASFGDAYTLSASDFAHCVRLHPATIATIYRYATAYLARLVDGLETESDQFTVNDLLPIELSEEACEVARTWYTRVNLDKLEAPEQGSAEVAHEFVAAAYAGQLTDAEMIEQVTSVFGELDDVAGTYATLAHHDERKRSLTAVLSVYWLQRDCYDSFVANQPEKGRMSFELWQEWQSFVRWVDMDEETFHAMLVLLTIRGLGKVPDLARSVPRDQRSPENIVLHLIEDAPHLVPSTLHVSEDMQDLIVDALGTHSEFNLAQMLQGENNPSHIQTLQQCVQEAGEDLLKFYLFNLVGIMCAIRGAESNDGSLFANQANGTSMLLGIQCLRQLTNATPHAIYWTYIRSRAVDLGLLTDKSEHLAIARLACLLRASKADVADLLKHWNALSRDDRLILVSHFLADGIHEKAFLFAFLPLYFANCKKNVSIGLHRALSVLIDLLELLRAHGCSEGDDSRTVNVSLSDLAAFARDVKAPRLFETVAAFSKFSHTGTEYQITISTKHWGRVNRKSSQEDPLEEMAYILKKVERKTTSLDRLEGQVQAMLDKDASKAAASTDV